MENDNNSGSEASGALSKKNIDHEVSVRRPPDIPITGGLGKPLAELHYQTFGNGARARQNDANLTRASDRAAGQASSVTEPAAHQRRTGEGAKLAATQTPEATAQEADRDRRNKDAADAKNANENDAAVANQFADFAQIAKAVKREIDAFKASPQQEGHQYERKFKMLMDRLDDESGVGAERWKSLLARYALKSNSFGVMRAVALWGTRREIRHVLEGIRQRRAAEGNTPRDEQVELEQIRHCLFDIAAIQSLDRMQILAQTGQKTVPVKSKKKVLPQLPTNWREQMVARSASSERYGAIIPLLQLIGCRPIELTHGIQISRDAGKAVIRVLRGAKVTQQAGQEWREYRVDFTRLPASVQDQLLAGAPMVELKIESTAALRQRLKDFSHDLGFNVVVTPYVFRHALAGDLREDGWGSEQIGAALGHASAETSRYYGAKSRRRKGVKPKAGISPQDVTVPRQVRPRASFDPKQIQRKPRKGTR